MNTFENLLGKARRGMARLGGARQDKATTREPGGNRFTLSRRGAAGRGKAGLGAARQGWARRGGARQGKATTRHAGG